ncbi:CAP domain-containing protein [Clostridioides difficile]|uniref:CAP domain-containing protein n=1 Tax=Clostridioides difficile TaxID=1496 RepID=UPI000D1F5B4C|nr:CAP domain-containing protein [Clostridioides difficile]HBG3869069.1 sporulation protein [Clostridioides difficile]
MRKNIPTKLKTILALGVLTLTTASSAVNASALSLENNVNTSNKNLVYSNTRYKFSAKPNCSIKPELKPDKDNSCKDKNHSDKNCNNTNKPDNNKPESNKPDDNNNSGSTDKPDNNKPESNKPDDNNNSGSTDKPDNNKPESNKPDDNNNSDSTDKPDNNKPESNKPNDNNNSDSTSENFSAYQKEVVDLVNIERSKAGLNPLTLDSSISNVATKKSQDMIDNNYFSHNSPTYGSPFDMLKKFGISYKTAGENIAMGQKTPKEVVNAWMNSEGHRKNIMNPNFSKIGVGVAQKSGGSIYWTQIFVG